MNIDVHAHHLPAAYMTLLREGNGPTFGAAHDDATLRKMIEGQDESGIDVQILSTGPNSPYISDVSLAEAAAHEVNNAYKRIVDQHDGRFAAFGSVPLPHPEAAAAEAVRCLDDLKFAGIHVGCSALGRSLDDPSFAEMWDELDRRAAVIYVHPGGILCGSEPGLVGMDDPGIAVTIGSAAEVATAALRFAALCRARRRLRVIIGLIGGSLPFLLQRVMWLGGRFNGKSLLAEPGEDGSLVAELRRFSYDVNFLPDPAVLVSAREAYGIDRLLFGSDSPSVEPKVTAQFMRAGGIDNRDFVAVLRDNPARLFGNQFDRQHIP